MKKSFIAKLLVLASVVAVALYVPAIASVVENSGEVTVEGSGANVKKPGTFEQRGARMAWWREARFGMFIHYGPVTLTGKELSWSRANSNTNCPNHGETPIAVYDNLYKKFNPANFNAADWAGVAKVDDYNIMHSPFHRDLCAELSHAGLTAFDGYLWRTRDSNHDGVLETWCIWDLGEDFSRRHVMRGSPTLWPFDVPPGSPGTPDPSNPKDFHRYWMSHVSLKLPSFPLKDVMVPFQSMDMMAYSYDMRATLAKISHELGNGQEKFWQAQAEQVRQQLIEKLWDEIRHACFDRDKNGKQFPELIHNNLRAMYHGIFTHKMADDFIKYHLLNTNEFWTKVPLPSIAVKEPLFRNDERNEWSGQSQALTYQRAIRALENYGRYSVVTELGQKLFAAVEGGGYRFTEQFDPLTGQPGSPHMDGYGPTALALLEYISRMHGIHLDVVNNQVWWSACDRKDFSYSQRWGDHKWTMTSTNGQMTANLNGKNLSTCSAGVRVVTDLDGRVIEMIGITSQQQSVTLETNGRQQKLTIKPDETIALRIAAPRRIREVTPRQILPPSTSREQSGSLSKFLIKVRTVSRTRIGRIQNEPDFSCEPIGAA